MLFEIYDCLKFSLLYCTLLPGEKLNLVILPSKSYKELRCLSEKKSAASFLNHKTLGSLHSGEKLLSLHDQKNLNCTLS